LNEGFERRFGGLRRLYGARAPSAFLTPMWWWWVWAAWVPGPPRPWGAAGWGRITLIDMDHVSESNTNRQIHALTPQFGQAKVEAMRAAWP
jgi:tRNA threonylcarbamoyladenosine dehydratase